MKRALCYSILLSLLVIGCKPKSNPQTIRIGLTGELREAYINSKQQPSTRTVWDSITVQGIGSDSILYNNSHSISKIILPLHDTQDSTGYLLTYHGAQDTVWAYHSNQLHFLDIEVGCVMHHSLHHIQHTSHWIDSIAVIQSSIAPASGTNILLICSEQAPVNQ